MLKLPEVEPDTLSVPSISTDTCKESVHI